MSDEALDRELRAALNETPSPEFVARVGAHARAQGAMRQAGVRAAWYWTGGLAAASVIGAVFAGTMLDTVPVALPPAQQPAPMVTAAPLTPLSTRDRTPVEMPSTSRPARRPEVTRVAAPIVERTLPEVLLSADEQRALRLLIRLASESKAADTLRQRPAPERGDALTTLDIQSLEIDPLPQIARLE